MENFENVMDNDITMEAQAEPIMTDSDPVEDTMADDPGTGFLGGIAKRVAGVAVGGAVTAAICWGISKVTKKPNYSELPAQAPIGDVLVGRTKKK